jgi:hypothetical protein
MEGKYTRTTLGTAPAATLKIAILQVLPRLLKNMFPKNLVIIQETALRRMAVHIVIGH